MLPFQQMAGDMRYGGYADRNNYRDQPDRGCKGILRWSLRPTTRTRLRRPRARRCIGLKGVPGTPDRAALHGDHVAELETRASELMVQQQEPSGYKRRQEDHEQGGVTVLRSVNGDRPADILRRNPLRINGRQNAVHRLPITYPRQPTACRRPMAAAPGRDRSASSGSSLWLLR